jgi:hypothetical protein
MEANGNINRTTPKSQKGWKITAIISISLFVMLLVASAVLLVLNVTKDKDETKDGQISSTNQSQSDDKQSKVNEVIFDSAKSGYKTIDVTRGYEGYKTLYMTFPNGTSLDYNNGNTVYDSSDELPYANTKIYAKGGTVTYDILHWQGGGDCSPDGTSVAAIKLTKTSFDRLSLMEVVIGDTANSESEVQFQSVLVKTGEYDNVKVGDDVCKIFWAGIFSNASVGLASDNAMTKAHISFDNTSTDMRSKMTAAQAMAFINNTKTGDKTIDDKVDNYQETRQILLSLSETR